LNGDKKPINTNNFNQSPIVSNERKFWFKKVYNGIMMMFL
jgi:hypothetical protein